MSSKDQILRAIWTAYVPPMDIPIGVDIPIGGVPKKKPQPLHRQGGYNHPHKSKRGTKLCKSPKRKRR